MYKQSQLIKITGGGFLYPLIIGRIHSHSLYTLLNLQNKLYRSGMADTMISSPTSVEMGVLDIIIRDLIILTDTSME